MRWLCLALILALGTGAVMAEAVKTSPRPMPRPIVLVAPMVRDVIRPRARPEGLVPAPNPQPEATAIAAIAPMLRPKARPAGLAQSQEQDDLAAAPTKKKPGKDRKSQKGSVCGDPAIKGEKLARITSKVKGCGVDDPVQVTSVDGIRLSQPATMDCTTAAALKTWVKKAMRPAFGNREVVELRIAAHYICRPRNNIKGNKISEHGRGKAIDISGFIFSDGKEWTVARDYNKQIRKAHKNACGIFGTTLGPGSDGYHEDHLHFDTASYRGGPYCR
jgi:hypothetical protein